MTSIAYNLQPGLDYTRDVKTDSDFASMRDDMQIVSEELSKRGNLAPLLLNDVECQMIKAIFGSNAIEKVGGTERYRLVSDSLLVITLTL